VSHPFFTLVVGPEVKMKKRKLSKIGRDLYKKRTAVIYLILALVFSGLLRSGDQFTTLLLIYTATFWVYTYIELRRKYHRPRDPETKATLRVSTEPFVDWAVTTMQGELVVSGLGNRTVSLPNTGDHVEREMKVKFSEFVYVVEVTSGNGDAFVSLTVDGDDEFLQTVACGRSGDPEVLYTHLNTGYGTKHWLIPGFMQGIPV
jgi:hypothetical protein